MIQYLFGVYFGFSGLQRDDEVFSDTRRGEGRIGCGNISHLTIEDETQTKDTDVAGVQRDISVSPTTAPAGERREG